MVTVFRTKYGGNAFRADAKIGLLIHVTNLKEGDQLSEEEALLYVEGHLDNLAGSNDGSEVLANIPKENISFP